jgi:hypothetical protein
MANNNIFKIWAGQGGAGSRSYVTELYRDFEGDEQLNSPNPTYALGPSLQFSRPTAATFYSNLSNIQTTSINIPRFEYSHDGTAFKGLLIEEQRTNLVTYSSNFALSGTWRPTMSSDGPGVSIQSNVTEVSAPDGTFTAGKMFMNPAKGYRNITWIEGSPFVAGNANLGEVYTRSIYIKRDTARYISIGCDGTTLSAATSNVFDFENPGFNDGNLFTMFWEEDRDGWYRIGFYRTSSNSNTNKICIGFSPVRAPSNYAVDTLFSDTSISETASSVFIWGTQVEKGFLPTSFIPTSGAQLIRAADKVSLTRSAFITVYNPISSSIFIKGSRTYPQPATYFSVSNNQRGKYLNLGAEEFVVEPGVQIDQVDFLSVVPVSGTSAGATIIRSPDTPNITAPRTIAAGIENNNMILYQDQQLVGQLTVDASLPVGLNNFYIGSIEGTDTFLNGHISKLHYWPYRLDNATLAAQT